MKKLSLVFKMLFLVITLFFFTQCQKEENDCIDNTIKQFNNSREHLQLIFGIEGKTLRFQDSSGMTLDFTAEEFFDTTLFHFVHVPCGIIDKFGVYRGKGDHYSFLETGVRMVSKTIPIRINYSLSYYLDSINPEPSGTEILIMSMADKSNFNYFAITELSAIGNKNVVKNLFDNTFIGALTFRLKTHPADIIGEKRTYQNVYKSTFVLSTFASNYHHQPSKDRKLIYISSALMPFEFYFNRTEGMVAFRFTDGTFWMRNGIL